MVQTRSQQRRIETAIIKTNKALQLRARRIQCMKDAVCSRKFAYFEKQVKMHCQLHAINNALQRQILTVKDVEKVRKRLLSTTRTKGNLKPKGGESGSWEKHFLFQAFIAKGGTIKRARLGVDGSQPLKFLENIAKQHSSKCFIMYVHYFNKTINKARQTTLTEVKHCVAYREGCIIDSVLLKAVGISDYPYLPEIKTVYELEL